MQGAYIKVTNGTSLLSQSSSDPCLIYPAVIYTPPMSERDWSYPEKEPRQDCVPP